MIASTHPDYSHVGKLIEQWIENPNRDWNTLNQVRRTAMAAGFGPRDLSGVADELDAQCIFRMDGRYWTGCGADEIAEVQHGGAFWSEPVLMDQDVAQWILDGREAPEL